MLTDCINDTLSQGIFPESSKFVNITPVHKKDEATDKEKYRPLCTTFIFKNLWKSHL